MQLAFVFYILISIIVISGTVYFGSRPINPREYGYGSSSQSGSGNILMAVLFLLISIFFGMRWFTPSGSSNIGTSFSTTWPPPNSIGVCPDYTILKVDNTTTPPTYTCDDTMGIATVASTTGTNASIPLNVIAVGISVSRPVASLCSDCYAKGLTWEGICIPNSNAPVNSTVLPPSPG